jgi:hypothetical protein
VFYDEETTPSIEMPFMDFLCDIECSSSFFHTIYFSKVKYSHNFRLQMPFGKHIKIEIENPTDSDLFGYMEIQWEIVPSLPENCGYLYVDYRTGTSHIPFDVIELCEINKKGAIVAHWLQIESEHPCCANGEMLCEGNNEIYLDSDHKPALEYLGTEDYYGYSWGFAETASDLYTVILKKDELCDGGSRIALLRCRDTDTIRFRQSCRVKMDYTQEYFSAISVNPIHKMQQYQQCGTKDFQAKYISSYYYYK